MGAVGVPISCTRWGDTFFLSLFATLPPPDLVPRDVVAAWLKYLRAEFPTVAFKACTQQQSRNLVGSLEGKRRGIDSWWGSQQGHPLTLMYPPP